MVRHVWEEHQGKKPKVIMRLVSRHMNPLDRLTSEAIWIAGH